MYKITEIKKMRVLQTLNLKQTKHLDSLIQCVKSRKYKKKYMYTYKRERVYPLLKAMVELRESGRKYPELKSETSSCIDICQYHNAPFAFITYFPYDSKLMSYVYFRLALTAGS